MRRQQTRVSFGQALGGAIKSRMDGIKSAFTFVLGFAFSGATIFSGLSPFGVAAVAAAPSKYLVQVAMGSCLAYLIPGIMSGSMKYFAAVLLTAAVKLFCTRVLRIQRRIFLTPLLAFGTMAVLSFLMLRSGEVTIYDIILTLGEALISGGITFFFARAFILYDQGITAISEKQDIISVVLSLCVVLIALAGIEIAGFSIGRCVAVVIVLICAYKGGAGFGSMAGVLAGISIGINDPAFFAITAAYGFAGLAAGVFASVEKVAVAAVFVLLNGIITIASGMEPSMLAILFEVMAGSFLFMLVPQSLMGTFNFGKFYEMPQAARGEDKDVAVAKLSFASSAMHDVSDAVEVVSEKLSEMENTDISAVFMDASQVVCKRCALRSYCWEKAYQTTMNAFSDIIPKLRTGGKVKKEDFPLYFTQKCVRLQDMIDQVNRNYYKFSSKENARRRIIEIRSIVAEQFDGISEYLGQLSKEFEEAHNFDMPTAKKVRNYFEHFGVIPASVNCVLDRYMRMTLDITLPTEDIKSLNRKRIGLDLSELCDRIFDVPSIDRAGKMTKVSLCEKASYTVDFGIYQMAYGEGKFCGDTVEHFLDLKGMAHMILSDGMGSGPSAAVDSAMAASLTTRLVKAGFHFSSALKMVNSALLVKSVDESLATVDITSIDLYTGAVQFLKAGAAPTFIRKNNHASMVEGDSLPIGILKGVDLFRKSTVLSEGDIVLMVSDGVTASGDEWILAEMESFRGEDMEELCQRICEQAKKRRVDGHDDDASAMACVIKKGV